MSPNKRIFFNVIATYGRSLYTMVLGLFTARWVLMSLGQSDYGLYGVIGGLTAFISFFNSLLGGAVGRFYAVTIGAEGVIEKHSSAVEECQMWFSAAVFIHTVIPIFLMSIGWPLGEYAIKCGWILVPADRINACLWVFRFTCLSCFISMISVPLNAMYTAKQYIAELTIYSFVTTTLNVVFLYFMVTHPGDWLMRYAAWTSCLSVLPSCFIGIRAIFLFPECRFRVRACLDWTRLKQICCFAGWQAFGWFGSLLRNQGIAILLNRQLQFGDMRNSSMTVANSLAGHTETLATSMIGAFSPAIFNAYGAGDLKRVRSLAFRTCKLGTVLTLMFAIPMLLEIDELLRVWLKNPPVYAAGLCWCILAYHIIDRLAVGHMLAVTASGKIAQYQFFLGSSLIVTLPLAWCLIKMNLGIYSVGWAMIVTMVLCAWGRVWFARTIVGMSAQYWFCRIFVPIIVLLLVCFAIGCLPRFIMSSCLWRIVLTTIVVESVLLPISYFFVLDDAERQFVTSKIRRAVGC